MRCPTRRARATRQRKVWDRPEGRRHMLGGQYLEKLYTHAALQRVEAWEVLQEERGRLRGWPMPDAGKLLVPSPITLAQRAANRSGAEARPAGVREAAYPRQPTVPGGIDGLQPSRADGHEGRQTAYNIPGTPCRSTRSRTRCSAPCGTTCQRSACTRPRRAMRKGRSTQPAHINNGQKRAAAARHAEPLAVPGLRHLTTRPSRRGDCGGRGGEAAAPRRDERRAGTGSSSARSAGGGRGAAGAGRGRAPGPRARPSGSSRRRVTRMQQAADESAAAERDHPQRRDRQSLARCARG